MLDIFNVDLKQTRFYQEVFAEGVAEGRAADRAWPAGTGRRRPGCWRKRPACRKRRLRGCAGKGADGAIGARKRGFQQHERPNPAVKVGAIGGNPALRHTRFPVPAVQRIG